MWKHQGRQRPEFAIEPGPGQESVWDYPRPPALALLEAQVRVLAGDALLVEAPTAMRVLETASPPTVYVSPEHVRRSAFATITLQTYCEWKGRASYLALAGDPSGEPVAWYYADPKPAFEAVKDWVCFYPDRVDCYIGEEKVRGQAGGFYGGWVTDQIVGPFKGEPGTQGW